MKNPLKLILLTFALFTACSTNLPELSSADADAKTEAFLLTASQDPTAAYAETTANFQTQMTAEAFSAFSTQTKLSDYASFDVTTIEHKQGLSLDAAKVDGTLTYQDSTQKSLSLIWSYDFEKKDWFLEGLRFS